jgi:hypothetical protein
MLRLLTEKRHFGLIQFAIAAGVLLASVYLAFTSGRAYALGSVLFNPVLLLLMAASVTLVIITRPNYGLAILLFISLISLTSNPALMRYANPAVLLIVLMLVIWVLDQIVIKRKLSIFPARPFLPLLVLIIAAILSFGVGQLRWFAFARPAPLDAQLAGLALYILSAGVFFLAAHQIVDYAWLRRLTWIFLALGGLYVAIVLMPGPIAGLRQIFTDGVTTSIFWIWLVVLSFSQAVFNKDLAIRWRIALAGLTSTILLVLMTGSYGWKSGWMPTVLAVLIIVYLRWPRLAIMATIVLGIFILLKDVPGQILQDDDYSYLTRLAAWDIILGKIFTVSPLFGLGPANYRYYTPLFSILGYNIQFNSHNNYIDILAQMGVVGLLAFAWFFWEVFRLGWRLKSRVPEGFARAYVIGALAGLVATVVSGFLGDWIVPFVYNVGIHGFQGSLLAWFFLGGLVALDRMEKDGQVE